MIGSRSLLCNLRVDQHKSKRNKKTCVLTCITHEPHLANKGPARNVHACLDNHQIKEKKRNKCIVLFMLANIFGWTDVPTKQL